MEAELSNQMILNLQSRDAKTLGLQHMLSAAPIYYLGERPCLCYRGCFSDGGNSYLARLDTQDYYPVWQGCPLRKYA